MKQGQKRYTPLEMPSLGGLENDRLGVKGRLSFASPPPARGMSPRAGARSKPRLEAVALAAVSYEDCSRNHLKHRRFLTGFTLIELMAGMGFFAFALLGLLALMGQSLELGHFSSNRTIALNEVRQVIEDVRRVADTSGLTTMVSTNFNKTLSDDILKSGSITVTDTAGAPLQNNADPLPVRIKISWSEKGKTVSYTVDTKVTDR